MATNRGNMVRLENEKEIEDVVKNINKLKVLDASMTLFRVTLNHKLKGGDDIRDIVNEAKT